MGSSRGYILPAGLGWNCWVCKKDICTVLKALNCVYMYSWTHRCVLARSQSCYAVIHRTYPGSGCAPPIKHTGMIFYIRICIVPVLHISVVLYLFVHPS